MLVKFFRIKCLFLLISLPLLLNGCGSDQSDPKKKQEPKDQKAPPKNNQNDPQKNENNEEPVSDTPPPENNPPEEDVPPVYQPDETKLDSLIYNGFKEKGPKLVAAFRAADPDDKDHAFSRFFADGKAGAQLPISDAKKPLLSAAIYPTVDQLKSRFTELRSGFKGIFKKKPQASGNILSDDEIEALGKLTPDELLVIDGVIADIQLLLFDQNKLRKEFEPYIFSGLSQDETIDKLYEGLSANVIEAIHRKLVFGAMLNIIQDINLNNQAPITAQYSTYFDNQSSTKLFGKRIKNAEKYISGK